VLKGIAEALELTPAERAHLMLLGRGEQVAPQRAPIEELEPTIRRLVEHLGQSPACITGRRFDFLAWNEAHAAVFGNPGEMPDGRRNLLWSVFMDPARRKLHADWNQGARRLVARFRSQAAKYVGDPDFESLIEALREGSPEFAEWRELHEVATSGVGRKTIRHPTAGKLVFEHAVFLAQENVDQRLVVYSPVDVADTPTKLRKLLAERS